MLKKVTLLALLCALVLSLAGCGEAPAPPKEEAPAPPPKPKEEPVPAYELTSDEVTSHEGWTAKNIAVMGLRIGDKTTEKEKALGKLDNTRTLANEYLTIYQNNGIFVYTTKLTGKAAKLEVYETFAGKIKDEKIKKLLNSGDLKLMRELLGQEEGTQENTEDNATEYVYDARGIRFVKYKVGGRTVNAIRFSDFKKPT